MFISKFRTLLKFKVVSVNICISWLTKMNKHGNKCIANVTLTKGSVLKSITSVSVKQRGFADDFIIKLLSVHAHDRSRTAEMGAAANYAVCFGNQDPAQSLCFFPQRTHLFSGSNTVPMLI